MINRYFRLGVSDELRVLPLWRIQIEKLIRKICLLEHEDIVLGFIDIISLDKIKNIYVIYVQSWKASVNIVLLDDGTVSES